MRLTIVQFGNYAEAYHRFSHGGSGTFYAQQYSVDFVGQLASRFDDVTVIHLSGDQAEQRLPNGVRSVGIQLYAAGRRARYFALFRLLQRVKPDHMILASPIAPVLAWNIARGIRTLPLFADSFQVAGLWRKLTTRVLVGLLNHPRIEWVTNHNLAASQDLVRIGVNPEKVLPYDWPVLLSPSERPVKTLKEQETYKLLYVGQISEPKGVGDVIDAVSLLCERAGVPRWNLTIVGGHDVALEGRAVSAGIGAQVVFAGRVPHEQVVPMMSQHDVVVVPSRHEYPEGLPMTIYEALCSRTPLVVSDHPMFRLKLKDRQTALIFPAGNAAVLADCLQSLVSDPELYLRLSKAAEQAAAEFFCPLKYGLLVSSWLSGQLSDHQALAAYSLSTGRYDDVLRGVLPAPA